MQKYEFPKVTAFVVSKGSPRQLLVFEHPLVGLQLPAGSVEPGEDLVEAAAREVSEETGLEVSSPGVVLGEQVRELGPDRAVLRQRVGRESSPIGRGHKVRIVDVDEGAGVAHIREEIYDFTASPPELISTTDATVSAECLAHGIRRTFVLFVEEPSRDKPWRQRADGHTFEVFWAPLRPDIPLVDRQKEWLVELCEALESTLSQLG